MKNKEDKARFVTVTKKEDEAWSMVMGKKEEEVLPVAVTKKKDTRSSEQLVPALLGTSTLPSSLSSSPARPSTT